MRRHESSRRPMILLFLGAATGAFLAAAGLVTPGGEGGATPAQGVVATVNGQPIRLELYERVMSAVASDRRNPINDAERRRVLDRLIEEELLLQRGVELGLPYTDRKVRADLISAVIQSVIAEAEAADPSEDELRKFYEENRDFFRWPARLRVRQIFLRVPDGADAEAVLARAGEAARRLRAGETYEAVRGELGEDEIAPVPDDLLPPTKLRDYIGPTATQTVLGLEVGGVSDPVRSFLGYHVLQLADREQTSTPPFADVRREVLASHRRRAGENALRDYVARLRDAADVAIAPEMQ